MVRNPPANSGDKGDAGLIPGSRGSPGEGNGNPLQYSCLENPMDRGPWHAAVHGVAKSWTRLKRMSMYHAREDLIMVGNMSSEQTQASDIREVRIVFEVSVYSPTLNNCFQASPDHKETEQNNFK